MTTPNELADPAGWPDPPERGRCWFLGCPHEVPQPVGGGRPKVVCDQWVDGLRHTRLNKSLARRGRISVPAPGSGPATPASAGDAGELERPDKPVTTARQTYGQTLGQVQATLAALPALVERLEQAARTVADQEQAAAEIAAVERVSRSQVDQAEAERDTALARARAKEREANDAEQAKAAAEEAAETALEAEELAAAERDQALAAQAAAGEREQQQRQRADDTERELGVVRGELERASERAAGFAKELAGAREHIEHLLGQLERAKQEATDTAADRDRVAGELAEQHRQTTEQRARAEEAEKAASRAEATAEQRRVELDRALEELRRARVDHSAELDRVRGDAEQRMTVVRDELRRTEVENRTQLDLARATADERVAAVREERRQADNTHREELERTRTEHRSEVAALRTEHREELAAERQRADAVLDDLRTEHRAQVEMLQAALTTLRTTRERPDPTEMAGSAEEGHRKRSNK